MSNAPAVGGGHWARVAPERLERWCVGFEERHGGPVTVDAQPDLITITASDGSVAHCHVPYPPVAVVRDPAAGPVEVIAMLAGHAAADRRIAVLAVRRAGFAIGLFDGARLVESKVGTRHVQGRTKAGGWSQKRYARRRDGQARDTYAAAADHAARILAPHAAGIDALVTGGDAGVIAALRSDPRLAGLFARDAGQLLGIGELSVTDLPDAPRVFRAVRIRVVEPSIGA